MKNTTDKDPFDVVADFADLAFCTHGTSWAFAAQNGAHLVCHLGSTLGAGFELFATQRPRASGLGHVGRGFVFLFVEWHPSGRYA